MPSLFSGFESIGAFLLLALGFGFIIFVHELGHFLAAKSVGIKVTQFALGFGPVREGLRVLLVERGRDRGGHHHREDQARRPDSHGDQVAALTSGDVLALRA